MRDKMRRRGIKEGSFILVEICIIEWKGKRVLL